MPKKTKDEKAKTQMAGNDSSKDKKPKKEKERKCDWKCRQAEYYGMQEVFDKLYQRSADMNIFTDLMPLILSRENILLAYRTIKANRGSKTAGVDGLKMYHIGRLTPDEVVMKVQTILRGKHGYRPKPVRRKDIPKPYDPTKTRPLGIPCIWDRLVQQCVKQVLEPICEAKFSHNSYGFRPNRSTEHAIASLCTKMNLSKLSYVIEFDIKGFFDNVNHSKLIKQLWALGIRDKELIYIIKQMLTAPIRMPDGTQYTPTKGTPQGGILSPLLANIVLNELDHWVEEKWEEHPAIYDTNQVRIENGKSNKQQAYKTIRRREAKRSSLADATDTSSSGEQAPQMSNKPLIECYIIRYADDFRILCRNREDAEVIMANVTDFLSKRLKLEVSPEKTRIVNTKNSYTVFLGLKFKLRKKNNKWVVKSHVNNKQLCKTECAFAEQAKHISRPRDGRSVRGEVRLYNSMVIGSQNYYRLATEVNIDFRGIHWRVSRILENRLRSTRDRHGRLAKKGRPLTIKEEARFGKSKMLRYEAFTAEPIYPIGVVRHRHPQNADRAVNCYSENGRKNIHDNLQINTGPMLALMRSPPNGASLQCADACISKYSAQWGKCYITKQEFQSRNDICCYFVIPLSKGGRDNYRNIVLVTPAVYGLLYTDMQFISKNTLSRAGVDDKALVRLNSLRSKAGLGPLSAIN